MSFFDWERGREAMLRGGFVALIAQSPENVQYVAGHSGFMNGIFHTGLEAAAVVFSDRARDPAVIVSNFESGPAHPVVDVQDVRTYETWIGIEDAAHIEDGEPRNLPVQIDPGAIFLHLREVLRDRDVRRGKVGVEMRGMSALAYTLLQQALPDVDLAPCDDLFSEIRAVKAPGEVLLLRQAAELTELGIEGAVKPGVMGATARELSLRYQQATLSAGLARPTRTLTRAAPFTVTVGPDPFPLAGNGSYVAREGDLIKFDCAATAEGYHSDVGRTYVLGQPDRLQEKLCAALLRGMAAAVERLKPGRPLREVYDAAMTTVRREGFPRYARGHVGHAIGVAPREDAPFISPTNPTIARSGMTFAVELPYYVQGLGGVIFEDNFVVTQDGAELLNKHPVAFHRLSR